MSYENNLNKFHKDKLKLGLIVIVLVGLVIFIDKYFNLGLLE